MTTDRNAADVPPARDHVGAAGKVLRVLELLAANPDGLTIAEVADTTGFDRAASRRFLITLVHEEYARQDGRQFKLTPRLLMLARSWIDRTSLWNAAEPVMRKLAETVGESCSASVMSGDDIVYVARVPGRRIMSVALNVGARLPAWCTSMGRAQIAGWSDAEIEDFLHRVQRTPQTPKSITGADRLRAEIRRVRDRGFAVVDEELEIGLRSISAPVRDRAGHTIAAINVATSATRYAVPELERDVLPYLIQARDRIEALTL